MNKFRIAEAAHVGLHVQLEEVKMIDGDTQHQ